MKNQDPKVNIQIVTKWETFSNFCERIKEELGETLYSVCNPFMEQDRIYMHIPDSNKNRVTLSITNYSGTQLGHRKIIN